RLLKEDVLRHAEAASPGSRETVPLETSIPERGKAGTGDGPASAAAGGAREEQVVPMSKLRRTIAERLVQAHQTAALLTTFNEADMENVLALRKQHGEAFQQKHNVKLGFMSFFVKAVIDGLKQFPEI